MSDLFKTGQRTIRKVVESVETVIIPNWELVPNGTKFTAVIDNVSAEGRIMKEGSDVYLCQNEQAGTEPDNLLGYNFGWSVGDGTEERLDYHDVSILTLELDPEFEAPEYVAPPTPLRIGSYDCTFHENYITVGCTRVDNELVREVASQLIDTK